MVEIGGFAANRIKTWQFETKRADDEDVMSKFNQNPPNVYGFGHVAYLEHVIEAVLHGKPSLVDGLEGRRSLELVTAIYESMATGAPVTMRFRESRSLLGRTA